MITHVVSHSGLGAEMFEPAKVRQAIFNAEALIVSGPPGTIPVDCSPTKHLFIKDAGIYAREVFLPAGSWNTGKLHAHDDLLIIAQGTVVFVTENGKTTLEGPCMTTVNAMTKPLVYAETDVWMYSAHCNPNGNTKPEEMESELIVANDPGEMPEVLKCLS